jgi:hypothetical protein
MVCYVCIKTVGMCSYYCCIIAVVLLYLSSLDLPDFLFPHDVKIIVVWLKFRHKIVQHTETEILDRLCSLSIVFTADFIQLICQTEVFCDF